MDKLNKKNCKHEFRQRLAWSYDSPKDDGYYCIKCLLEIKPTKSDDYDE